MDERGEGRGALAVGFAGLAGALLGAVVGGLAGAGLWAATHPNPEGLEGLAVVVVGMLAGAVLSYPGALVGVWLALRGRPGARRAVGWTAVLYPLIVVGPLLEAFGFRGPAGFEWFWLTIPVAFLACAAAGALASRGGTSRATGPSGGADDRPAR